MSKPHRQQMQDAEPAAASPAPPSEHATASLTSRPYRHQLQDIGQIIGLDEYLNHQIVDTFASVSTSEHSWTEKIWTAILRKDGFPLAAVMGGILFVERMDGRKPWAELGSDFTSSTVIRPATDEEVRRLW